MEESVKDNLSMFVEPFRDPMTNQVSPPSFSRFHSYFGVTYSFTFDFHNRLFFFLISFCFSFSRQLVLISRQNLNSGAWLGEFTGEVVEESRIRDWGHNGILFFCTNNKGKNFFIDAKKCGNELRFLRRTAATVEEANVRIFTLWLDGGLCAFLETTKEIPAFTELVAVTDEHTHWCSPPSSYSQMNELVWDSCEELDQRELRFRGNLDAIAEIRLIEDKNHPCCGERGLFAKQDIHSLGYIGEYTGRVIDFGMIQHLKDVRYQADFGLDSTETISVDASICGNECRFINDFRGTGKQPNVQMKRVWARKSLRIMIQATKDIQKGEEFLIDYGSQYWENLKK
jgi:hypothetical protein